MAEELAEKLHSYLSQTKLALLNQIIFPATSLPKLSAQTENVASIPAGTVQHTF